MRSYIQDLCETLLVPWIVQKDLDEVDLLSHHAIDRLLLHDLQTIDMLTLFYISITALFTTLSTLHSLHYSLSSQMQQLLKALLQHG